MFLKINVDVNVFLKHAQKIRFGILIHAVANVQSKFVPKISTGMLALVSAVAFGRMTAVALFTSIGLLKLAHVSATLFQNVQTSTKDINTEIQTLANACAHHNSLSTKTTFGIMNFAKMCSNLKFVQVGNSGTLRQEIATASIKNVLHPTHGVQLNVNVFAIQILLVL